MNKKTGTNFLGFIILGMIILLVYGCEGSSVVSQASPTPTPGGILYAGSKDENSILGFHNANSINGNLAPNTRINGANTTLNGPYHLDIDTTRNILYMTSYGSDTILIYDNPNTATGNIAPNRTITGINTGLDHPSGLHIDPVNNVLYVTNSGSDTVSIYDNAATATGNVAPSRQITALNSGPRDIFVDADRNVLYVSLGTTDTIGVWDNAQSVNGAIPPDRSVTGPASALNNPDGLYVDTANNVLYLANQGGSIAMFSNASAISGYKIPPRTLIGANTGLNNPTDVIMASNGNYLYVCNYGDNSILIYDDANTLNGDVGPTRVLSGDATHLNGPTGISFDADSDG